MKWKVCFSADCRSNCQPMLWEIDNDLTIFLFFVFFSHTFCVIVFIGSNCLNPITQCWCQLIHRMLWSSPLSTLATWLTAAASLVRNTILGESHHLLSLGRWNFNAESLMPLFFLIQLKVILVNCSFGSLRSGVCVCEYNKWIKRSLKRFQRMVWNYVDWMSCCLSARCSRVS